MAAGRHLENRKKSPKTVGPISAEICRCTDAHWPYLPQGL